MSEGLLVKKYHGGSLGPQSAHGLEDVDDSLWIWNLVFTFIIIIISVVDIIFVIEIIIIGIHTVLAGIIVNVSLLASLLW